MIFIKQTRFCFIVYISLSLFIMDAYSINKKKQSLSIGVCSSFSKSDLLKNVGCAFVEEGVKGILMHFNGGRHPLGYIGVKNEVEEYLIPDTRFDDLENDRSLFYVNN